MPAGVCVEVVFTQPCNMQQALVLNVRQRILQQVFAKTVVQVKLPC